MAIKPGGGQGGDDKTVVARPGGAARPGGSEGRTVISSDNDGTRPREASSDALDEKTRVAGVARASSASGDARTVSSPKAADRVAVPDGGRTVLHRPGASGAAPPDLAMDSDDPVVGWLVVEHGPGKGRAVALGMGMNAIGRGADQRVRLDFGDPTISSSKHFFVSYDPRSRQFAIHRGDGANLTYLDGAPVYHTETLASFSRIEVGGTTLCFVALCGDRFDWSE